jgi:hypothetical protein
MFQWGEGFAFAKTPTMKANFGVAGGTAIVREEVWVDVKGRVVRYNLAFLLPHLFSVDNGRVLGFDNAHGVHERHYMGEVAPIVFKDYPTTMERFYGEVEELRRSYED